MFKLAVFTDEISQDLHRAIDMAQDFKLKGLEIRSVWNKNLKKLTTENAKFTKKGSRNF